MAARTPGLRALWVTLGCATVLALVVPAGAAASDPGRWRLTGRSTLPVVYYQGITSGRGRSLYFDGVYTGLYRTDSSLHENGAVPNVIPPDVKAREGYNHIGDIGFDPAGGGRVLLPLECYYPGTEIDANTCRTGSIGVADRTTLAWRYYVKLDPADIPKAMWNEVSPNGRLLWTSSGNDLLAYRTADISPANAAPNGPAIRPVRRLRGAVPPSGITGATFYAGRLFLAGQRRDRFQVWSVDLASGTRRLEIERTIIGESEGLDTVSALGGVLHWMVTPYDPAGRTPTYDRSHVTLLHFTPRRHRPHHRRPRRHR